MGKFLDWVDQNHEKVRNSLLSLLSDMVAILLGMLVSYYLRTLFF